MDPFKSFLSAATLAALACSSVQANPIWQAEGEQSFRFLGTIHMMRDSDYPLPAAFEEALAQCDVLWLETDIEQITDPAFQNDMTMMMMAEPGNGLTTQLPEPLYQRLGQWSQAIGIPIEALEPFEPWAATLVISAIALEAKGYSPELSVDEHLHRLAIEAGIDVRFLEGGLEQVQLLANAGKEEGLAMVEQGLDDLDQLDELMDTMLTAWRSGDMETLWEATSISRYPAVQRILLEQRNHNWVDQLTTNDQPGSTHCVAAGSLHFAGDNSVLELLKAKGYSITQL